MPDILAHLWGMDRNPIKRVSVADQVAAVLRQRILDGEMRPGTALPEIPLASSLGVSRNTMREAVRILSLEGLLKRSIHRGVTIPRLSVKDLKEIYEVRRLLEIQAVLSTKNGPKELLKDLHLAVDGYERSVRLRDWAQAVSWDLQFHGLLIRFLGNKRLEKFYQTVIGELRMGMVLVDRRHDDPGILVPIHRRLYALLAAGKVKQCAELLSQHLDDSESRLSTVMANGVAAFGKPDEKADGSGRRATLSRSPGRKRG